MIKNAYANIKAASPEELLEAVIHHYQALNDEGPFKFVGFENNLRKGFAVAGEGGWRHVAPMWLEDYRKRCLADEGSPNG